MIESSGPQAGLRIFLTYAREDRALLERVAATLQRVGLVPVWDEGIRAGMDFRDAIKESIATSHILMPLLTCNSQGKSWVHHEIGFAIGIDVPVIPLAVSCLPEGMIASVEAVEVQADLQDLESQILRIDFETLTTRSASELGRLGVTYEVADSPEDRARVLCQLAKSVRGHVRQNGIFSSFSLPDAHPDHEAWNGFEIKGDHHRNLLRLERRLLQECGQEIGYSLIIHPFVEFVPADSLEHRARLYVLQEFLLWARASRRPMRVAICRAPFEGSFASVGDWFGAKALPPQPGKGFRQTIFTRHAPTVHVWNREFDRTLDTLLKASDISEEQSLGAAIESIEQWLR